jgi:glyceraldehyde 3-phosphate dehydrogenase
MSIGINGFGRIGKCVFLQLIENPVLHVAAINAPDFNIQKLDVYLKHDSVHHTRKDYRIEIIDENTFSINGRKTHLLRNRDASKLNWRDYGVNHIIEASGVYLTEAKARQHNVDYVIMSAPAKDDTPLFVPGANLQLYNGEKIVSCASCTTNCITPVLRHLSEHYGISNANFTTIHASTASQKVVDTAHSKSRTERSIFNNIIPHTTGATSSIFKVLPELTGKIHGTSVRVPTNNVSLVDLNVELSTSTDLDSLFRAMESDKALLVCADNLVSSDFMTTECPSIVDKNASMHLGGNRFKLMIWYDNEWSYASQMIKLVRRMLNPEQFDKYFIESHTFKGKNVVLRLDLNVPMKAGVITDDFRIVSALPTINRILKDEPQRLVILSHLGRPKGYDAKYSLESIHPCLESHVGKPIRFLRDGISANSMAQLDAGEYQIYLMENMRFHEEETEYASMDASTNDVIQMVLRLGDVYVNDAFGCVHRDHLSIKGIHCNERAYGYLIDKELRALNTITKNTDGGKILAIVGGGKMDDKLELLKNLCKKVDTIYIAGGNINSLLKNDMKDYLIEIGSHKAKIVIMTDGLCASKLDDVPKHISTEMAEKHENFFDIGFESFSRLHELICEHEIIFWNGTLGVVEDAKYKKGSDLLVKTLMQEMRLSPTKKVIVGGGDTGGFVNKYDHGFTHISTGGGAAIEYITFDTLTGLDIFS